MKRIKYIYLVFSCLLLSSCVTSQSDVDSLRQQVHVLQRQQQADKQEITRKLEDYQARLEVIDEGVSEAGGSILSTQANLWAEVESMRVQVATLTGRLDALEREYSSTRQQREEIDGTLSQLRTKTRELDRSIQMISSQLGLEVAGAQPALPSIAEPVEAVPDLHRELDMRADAAQPLYQRALDSFYDRNYELAQSLWEEFTDHFPDHALASNAYFWQGESFYQMHKYAQAALAYQEVITNFPESNKVVASMLKQGMSFFQLGREEAGELVLNELVNKFPDTAEARRARAFMSE